MKMITQRMLQFYGHVHYVYNTGNDDVANNNKFQ